MITTEQNLIVLQRLFSNMASLLPADAYLRYKKSIMQCSSVEALGKIGKSLVEELCG